MLLGVPSYQTAAKMRDAGLKVELSKLYRLPSGVRHMTCYLPGTSSGSDLDSMRLLRRTDFRAFLYQIAPAQDRKQLGFSACPRTDVTRSHPTYPLLACLRRP